MKKNLKVMFSVVVMLIMSMAVHAQKIDVRLSPLLSKTSSKVMSVGKTKGASKMISVQAYLKQGAECPTALLEQMGITVRYVVDDVAVLVVPVNMLVELEHVEEIAFIKADAEQRYDNDVSRTVTKADQLGDVAKSQAAGLPQAYTGKGVLLGIIDGGIDFNHAAFRDPVTGATRIKKVVMFSSDTGDKTIYTTPEEIGGLKSDGAHSHGTHTTSIAAGSNLGNGLQGLAPEADIMIVSMGSTTSETNIAEGIQLIADYAKEIGKPCVISISMGMSEDLHDGSSLVCKKVRELTNGGEKEGVAVCIASGNDANKSGSIVKKLGAADADGWQMKLIMGGEIAVYYNYQPAYDLSDVFIYALDGKDFTAELRLVNIETGEIISDISDKFSTIVFTSEEPTNVSLEKNSNYPNAKGGTSVIYRLKRDDNMFCLKKGYEKYRPAIFIKGTSGQEIRAVHTIKEANEPQFLLPPALQNKGYDFGSGVLSCNTNNCDDAVISVGSYVCRNEWTYHNQGSQPNAKLLSTTDQDKTIENGSISEFSSYADADDNGKARPTLIGPGQNICSAYNLYDESYFTTEGGVDDYDYGTLGKKAIVDLAPIDKQILNKFNRNHYYGYMGGTSMSTPHVAGILALWMQAENKLTVNKIKSIMGETCLKDSYVTDIMKIPSMSFSQAGYGKIDALAGLKKILNTTAIDVVISDGERQATPATMYDVDAPVYNVMGQQVAKDTPGVVIYKGKKYINK